LKKIILVLSLLCVFALAIGCQEVKEAGLEAKLESEGMGDANVDLEKGEITVETESGANVKIEGFKEGEWCPKDAKVTAESSQGEMIVNFVGIVEGGEFNGLCHKVMEVEGPTGPMEVNVYVSEDGEGFQVLSYNGQEIKQEYKE